MSLIKSVVQPVIADVVQPLVEGEPINLPLEVEEDEEESEP